MEKWILLLVNFVATIFLTIQLSILLKGYISPTLTHTWQKDLHLGDVEFPIVIKICVIPTYNMTALYEHGYEDEYYYFLGQSRFNESAYGWAGHTNSSKNLGTVEAVLSKVTNRRLETLLEYIHVWTSTGEEIPIPVENLKTSSRVSYPHNCHSLNLSIVPEIKGRIIEELFLRFVDLGEFTIEIQFVGQSLHSNRFIKEHAFLSTGDTIQIDGTGRFKEYLVEIAQRNFVEEDPSQNCKNYPTPEFSSYDQCDETFFRNLLKTHHPHLNPIWLTANLSEVSQNIFDSKGTFGE